MSQSCLQAGSLFSLLKILIFLVFGFVCGNVPLMWILKDCDLYAKDSQT